MRQPVTHPALSCGRRAFTRAKWALVTVTLVPDIFPFGLAVYSIGIKNMSTPISRPIAFAVSTVLANAGMFGGFFFVDLTKKVRLRRECFHEHISRIPETAWTWTDSSVPVLMT